MKTFFIKGFFAFFLMLVFSVTKLSAQTVAITAPASGTTITAGSTITVTATRSSSGSYGGSGNWTWTFATSPTSGVTYSVNPVVVGSGSTQSTDITFANPGTYSVTVTVTRANGGATAISPAINIIVNVPSPSNQPIGCNGQFFISHGTAGTSSSTTLLDKLTFSGGNINSVSFSGDPTGIGFNAIGINPLDGYMYGIRYSPMHLVKIGSGTPGNINDLGTVTNANISSGDNAYAGCFDSNGDFFFMTDANEFYKISGINSPTVVLAATFIGTVSPSTNFFVDIAIDPTDGQMYGVSGTGSSGKNLYKINKTNGALTLVGTYSGTNYIAALFFDEVGGLYGYRQDGTFQQINKTNAAQTQVGTAATYTYADGCSCSFGRVFHDLDFTANPGNQLCPTGINPNPTFPLLVSVTNQTSSQQTGLTYTLNMVDPLKRFKFTESAATIKANLIAAGVATAASTVTLTTEAPAIGINNKVVVTGFQTGGPGSTLSFNLQVQLANLGGPYNSVPLQSEITGLVVPFGPNDLSNDPGTIAPDDPTVISFCPNITLPSQLGDFSVTKQGADAILNWQTVTEINADHFVIERSYDGVTFVPAGTKQAAGNSFSLINYDFSDPITISSGNIYYRLKTVDMDGKSSYSKIIVLRLGTGIVRDVIVYPNPFTSNLKVEINSNKVAEVTIQISNSIGQRVVNRNILLQKGSNVIVLTSALQNLKPGIHLMEIIFEDGKLTQKIIKR